MKGSASDVGQISRLDDQGLAGIAGVHDLQCFGPKMTKEDSTVYNLKVCIHDKPCLLHGSGHTRKLKASFTWVRTNLMGVRLREGFIRDQVPVVQKVNSSIHRINHYPVDSAIGFPNNFPLDGDLSGG